MVHQEEIPVQRSGMFWVAIVTIAVALCVTAYNYRPVHRATGDLACYTDDDGQSWFRDSTYKIVPFDHNGKQAYRAMVFTYANGRKDFTLFLIRYSSAGQKLLNDAVAKAEAKNLPLSTLEQTFSSAGIQEIKAPGPNHAWVPRTSREAKPLLNIESPDGSAVDMMIP